MLVVLAGTFMSVLDFFIVNVAIPSMQRDLRATAAQIQFVVAGYALAYAGGLITGGRLGDLYGRRRLFLIGMAAFTLASMACGLAPTAAILIVARIAQGLAAAFMTPQVLSILAATYAGQARLRALNAYGVTMGIAAVLGQLIGGVLIQTDVLGLGWRGCFLINLPIGLVTIALIPRHVPESRATGKPRLDIVGMVLVSAATTAVVLPLIEGRQQGWPLWAWLCLIASLPAFLAFGRYERGVARRYGWPLVDPTLFRERAFTAGLTAQVVFFAALASFYLALAIYLQVGRGLNPLQAGLIFVATGAGYLGTSTNARHFAARWGRQVIAVGGVMRAVGLTLMIFAVGWIGDTGSGAWLVPGLIIDGAGMGLALAPLTTTILSRIPPQHIGAASGVLNTGFWTGNALGVAISGVIFYGVVSNSTGGNPYPHAFLLSLIYFALINVAVALLVQMLPRTPGGGISDGGHGTRAGVPSRVAAEDQSLPRSVPGA
jgi:EmrB/QacA subfamily drug resistance transporter